MSIYATYWQMRLPVYVPCPISEAEAWQLTAEAGDRPVKERWIEVYAQAVPAHIGHPSEYPEGDPYAHFLPPVVEYDPDDWDTVWIPRAVVIVDEDHREKDGQRYVDPLMMLKGPEYEAMTFSDLLARIQSALERRFADPPYAE
jgi:hypothetical protein